MRVWLSMWGVALASFGGMAAGIPLHWSFPGSVAIFVLVTVRYVWAHARTIRTKSMYG